MKKLFAMILGVAGTNVSSFANSACAIGWFDEPEMSKSMIER